MIAIAGSQNNPRIIRILLALAFARVGGQYPRRDDKLALLLRPVPWA